MFLLKLKLHHCDSVQDFCLLTKQPAGGSRALSSVLQLLSLSVLSRGFLPAMTSLLYVPSPPLCYHTIGHTYKKGHGSDVTVELFSEVQQKKFSRVR